MTTDLVFDEENLSSEKEAVMHLEHQPCGLSSDDEVFLANFSDKPKAKVLRKVNWRLVPMLVLLYLIAYIDKTKIGNATIEGLLPDLGMNGNQYNIALSVSFIPYVLAELPSNIILNRFKRTSLYLGSLIFAWGIIMTCTGFVRKLAPWLASGFSLAYSRRRFFRTRIAILYTSAASGGAFSGLLAFVIAKMDGIAGYEGWRWFFIIEGLATILLAFLTFFLLLDSPQLSSGRLMPDEIRFLEVRQMANSIQGTQQSGVSWGAVISVLTDWKIYLLILASWSNSVPNYALKFVMPQIIQRMGFTSAKAQLLTIPPYAVGALSAYVFSIFADHYAWRGPFIIAPQLLQVVAFSILFTKASEISDNVALCYFGACLACFGLNRNKARQSEAEIRQRYTDEELNKMEERSPLFQYTL
ncbi:hypothetical protein ETB97_007528 [Aspergillus alliaceus]|uniref:Major facilitator superfamily (MFS) profile domain-containing protein n=1 Tax=Petromyces alliaceus TaxID=209559 RepID=A0A8H6E2Y2_PETAA|nr:hypothetical protein ETB97_007528 [Aspergillus burnettii]